nr:MAG TPA: hypothetical protein [Caudoviricetes sp.]
MPVRWMSMCSMHSMLVVRCVVVKHGLLGVTLMSLTCVTSGTDLCHQWHRPVSPVAH